MAKRASDSELAIRPLTPAHVDDLKVVTAGTWGSTCWDLFPRYTAKDKSVFGGVPADTEERRRAVMARLARRRNAPGLIAYRGREPVGWVAIGPRFDFARIAASRATPPVDELAVWVIPCITVRRGNRGKGLAVAMIRAAVDYAARFDAPAVEAYPRADNSRLHDDFVFFGNEAMFRKAGFRQVRGALPNTPKSWVPRVTMRRVVRTRAAPGAPRARRVRTSADAPRQVRRAASARPQRSRRMLPSAGARRTGSVRRTRAPAR
jgi:GNAT superfamily N-acetyltransferase